MTKIAINADGGTETAIELLRESVKLSQTLLHLQGGDVEITMPRASSSVSVTIGADR